MERSEREHLLCVPERGSHANCNLHVDALEITRVDITCATAQKMLSFHRLRLQGTLSFGASGQPQRLDVAEFLLSAASRAGFSVECSFSVSPVQV